MSAPTSAAALTFWAHRTLRARIANFAAKAVNWWIGELTALVPRRIRARFERQVDILLVDLSSARPLIAHVRKDGIRTAMPVDDHEAVTAPMVAAFVAGRLPRRHKVVLRIPSTQVLWKSVTLPATGEAELRQILRFEVDRRTPFRMDEVYFDFVVHGRDPVRRTISVEWIVAPCHVVDEPVRKASEWGLRVDLVDAGRQGATGGTRINLLATNDARSANAPNRVGLFLLGIAACVSAAAVYVPLQRQQAALIALEERVVEAKGQAEAAARARIELQRVTSDHRLLDDVKRSAPSIVRIVHDVTRLLPDDTWLAELQVIDREVHITGYTASTSALVTLIEGSASFRNVRFRSPVTLTAAGDRERFQISFVLAEETGR